MSVLLQVQSRWMLWLIQANLTTSGKLHFGNRSPSRFLNFGELDALLRERIHFRFQILAHEIEFVSDHPEEIPGERCWRIKCEDTET